MVLSRNKRSSTTDGLDCDQGGKRQKGVKDANRDSSRQSSRLVDDEGNVFWQLADRRRVTIATFRKETKINIREYYEQDGKMLPGKRVRFSLFYQMFWPFARSLKFCPLLFVTLNLTIGYRAFARPISLAPRSITRYCWRFARERTFHSTSSLA